ncbi:MAG: DNA topoisomerase VI subunit B [Promethearchaeia archaeon]
MTQSPNRVFTSISPAEFFYRNRQMAGFGNPTQAVYSAVRELVENSLDSCEDAGKRPKIKVEIDESPSSVVRISVSDNGEGIPDAHVADSFGRVLYGSKYLSRQRRGTFGLGVTMAVLYGQITTENPVKIYTCTERENTGRTYELFIDVENNRPIIISVEHVNRSTIGTSVRITMKGSVSRAYDRIVDYLKLTSVSTPHSQIELVHDGKLEFSIGPLCDTLPPSPVPVKPHPHAADMELLRRLVKKRSETPLRQFLQKSFQQVGRVTSSKIIDFLAMNPQREVGALDRSEINRLSTVLQNFNGLGRPTTECLSPIGEHAFMNAVCQTYDAADVGYATKGPFEWSGHPFIVEGVVAIGGKLQKTKTPILHRFTNRVPLLYDASEDVMTKVLNGINWSRYGLTTSKRVGLFIHFCSTRVPYKATGKQSVAGEEDIESQLALLYKELGRYLRRMTKDKRKRARRIKEAKKYSKWLTLIAELGTELSGADEVPPIRPLVEDLFEVNLDV